MWTEFWGVEFDQRLAPAQQQLLADCFCAWGMPQPLDTGALARVGPWDAQAEQQALTAHASPARPLRSTPGGLPVGVRALAGPSWVLTQGTSRCLLELSSGEAALVRCDGPHTEHLLFMALTEVFRCAGWLTVHAAGQAATPGGVRLALGRSGAGKSTWALTGCQAGARFMAEDRVWLRARDLLLVPRDRRLRLLQDGRRWVPPERQHFGVPDPDGKLRYPLPALGLIPADPALPDALDVLLGPQEADPLAVPPRDRSARKRLLVTQAVWEALGLPLVPGARQATMQAAQALLAIPCSLWWRDSEGQVHRCAD